MHMHVKDCGDGTWRYHLDDYPDGWLFDPEHDEDWRRWHEEHDRMCREILVAAIRCGCVRVSHEGSRIWYYVHHSTRRDLMQVTCWDEHGPVGHVEVADGRQLAREISWREVTVEAA